MATLFFALVAAVCCAGWLNMNVCAKAILMWAMAKGLTSPGDEIKEYLEDAWRMTLHLK